MENENKEVETSEIKNKPVRLDENNSVIFDATQVIDVVNPDEIKAEIFSEEKNTEPVVEVENTEPTSTEFVEGFGSEDQKKKKIIIIGACILAIVAVVALGVIFYLFSSPKTVMVESLNKFKGNVKDVLKTPTNSTIEKILSGDKASIKSNILIKANGEDLGKIDFAYSENKDAKKSYGYLDFVVADENLLNLEVAMKNSKLFLNLGEAGKLFADMDFVSLFENTNIGDSKLGEKLVDLIFDSIKKEIDKSDIEKSKEKIEVNGKEKKVTKLSYKITGEETANIEKNILNGLLDDKDLMKLIADLSQVSVSELEKQINSELKNIKTVDMSPVYYNVYYYGFNNVVRVDFEDSETNFAFYDYKGVKEYTISEKSLAMKSSDSETIIEEEELVDVFKIKITDEKGKKEIKGKVSDYSFNGTYEDGKLDLTLVIEGLIINVKYENEVEEKDGYISNEKLTLGMLGTSIELKAKTTVDSKEIECKTDFSDAIDLSQMSEEELSEFMMTLISKLIPDFGSMIGGEDYPVDPGVILTDPVPVDGNVNIIE